MLNKIKLDVGRVKVESAQNREAQAQKQHTNFLAQIHIYSLQYNNEKEEIKTFLFC